MATVVLTKDNYDATVAADGIVLVDCWAPWCAGCDKFAEVYEAVASRHREHVFGKPDTQTQRELVSDLGVEHIPSLLLYRDGVLLFQQPGSFDDEALEDIVAQAESIDMDAVRAHVAAQEPDAETACTNEQTK